MLVLVPLSCLCLLNLGGNPACLLIGRIFPCSQSETNGQASDFHAHAVSVDSDSSSWTGHDYLFRVSQTGPQCACPADAPGCRLARGASKSAPMSQSQAAFRLSSSPKQTSTPW